MMGLRILLVFLPFYSHGLLGGLGRVGFSWLPCFVYRI
jgi:hypothetical protein